MRDFLQHDMHNPIKCYCWCSFQYKSMHFDIWTIVVYVKCWIFGNYDLNIGAQMLPFVIALKRRHVFKVSICLYLTNVYKCSLEIKNTIEEKRRLRKTCQTTRS